MASTRRLEDHFIHDIRKLGLDPARLPDNLFFTYCGDILGSSGEHYAKGKRTSLSYAAKIANSHYSDDFAESLAMHLLADKRWKADLQSLMSGRDDFLEIIRGHYIAYGLQYSPWAAALFEEKNVTRYGILLADHNACGAAMRAAALAPHKEIDEQLLFPFFLITHANAEAIEGAYMVWGFARAVLEGKGVFSDWIKSAQEAGKAGRALSEKFLKDNNLVVRNDKDVARFCKTVLQSRDPYINITDISTEGVDTHFVVTSAFLILDEIVNGAAPEGDEVAYIIGRGLEIGGDPDTICSVTMGMAGMMDPVKYRQQLLDVEVRVML